MHGMTKDRQLLSEKLTNWCMDQPDFKQSQCQMSIHYNYSPDGSKLVVLSYAYEEELKNWFVDSLGNIFHVNFLGYAIFLMFKYIYIYNCI